MDGGKGARWETSMRDERRGGRQRRRWQLREWEGVRVCVAGVLSRT
jgi:hypothetical protein